MAASPTTRPGLTPADLVLQPHILRTILQSAHRETLATCLRVNSTFFHEAGAILYHTVRVDNANWQAFFLGAFVNDWHSEIIYCQCFDDEMDDDDDTITTTLYPELEDYWPTERNFKVPLLGYVRVLSLGSHHDCLCDFYGKDIGPLLHQLDTLRLVATPKNPFGCHDLCDLASKVETWEAAICPLVESTTPNKLVLRNQGFDMGYYAISDSWNTVKLKEAVYIVPVNQDALNSNGSIEHVPYLLRAPFETIVFRDPLEEWHPRNWGAHPAPKSDPLDVGLITETLDDYTTEGTQATLVGLESVEFWIPPRLLGRVSAEQASSPAILTPQWTRDVAMDMIRRGCREAEELATPNTFTFKTFNEHYAQEYHKRRFEIDDDMDPVLQVASLESQLLKLDV
ncbi:uncharacterized protein LOC62_01G001625 [Vanrija pseudolonga]|uniref:Uncharacterized protein n=1 Tax=Vanrija pseudolonga TaxID=143232 RepID=A0AAF1BG30_9TREE|nr:hypothetical protein LOC62_01G001625 [Vanrija pseudolonga]